MTREEIIGMALEADPFGEHGRLFELAQLTPGTLERFAALVAAKEREECAKVCDERANHCAVKADTAYGEDDAIELKSLAWQFSVLAANIRARGGE